MPIDWRKTQANIKVKVDGVDGDVTWSTLLRVIANRSAKAGDILAMARALKSFSESLGNLTSPARLISYLANTANETGGFTAFHENMTYSAARMAAVWPNRYAIGGRKGGAPNALAKKLAGDPVAFANDVYGARMGNERNGIADNDGFNFRGLGPMATTGFDNFAACEAQTGVPFTSQPALMAHPGTGTIGALSWWSRSGCNPLVDAGNSKGARSMANAGHPNVKEPEGWDTVAKYEAILAEVIA